MTLATSTGQNLGGVFAGRESRTSMDENNILSGASVNFNRGRATSFGMGAGTFIRGEGNTYTTYSTGGNVRTLNGGNFRRSSISVSSAEIDPITGILSLIETR